MQVAFIQKGEICMRSIDKNSLIVVGVLALLITPIFLCELDNEESVTEEYTITKFSSVYTHKHKDKHKDKDDDDKKDKGNHYGHDKDKCSHKDDDDCTEGIIDKFKDKDKDKNKNKKEEEEEIIHTHIWATTYDKEKHW